MTKAELRRQQKVQLYALPGLKRDKISEDLEDQMEEVRKLEESLRKTFKVMRLIFTPDYVESTVLEMLGRTMQELCKVTRKREIVFDRQILMYALTEYTNLSLKATGARFVYRRPAFDHTTVIHSRQTIRDLRDSDLNVRITLNILHIKILKEYKGKDLVTIKEAKNANAESIFGCIEFSTYQFPSLFDTGPQSQYVRFPKDAEHLDT